MTQDPTTRRRRLMRLALGLSLALNVMILGALGGAMWRHGGPGPRGAGDLPGLRSYASPYVQTLPPETRHELHSKMRASGKAHHLDREARRALYDEMLAALRAEPFQADVAAAVLAAQGEAAAGVQQVAHDAWLAEVSAMDAAARQDYADKLQQRLEAGPPRKKGKRDGRPER
ncbi:periplasmic heavy metal sensor [Sulfitobacter sp. 1A15258]|uniref:periplasmic heavy metal sensor n=2 Tax=unclassified Sulfitobacter TaxID=196795 RepID=UPI003746E988